MKKINYFFVLLFAACVLGSCSIGSYVPSSLNVGGVSTQVVLSQANYRVVRNIETVVDINNTNLRRADVEKSAFAELMRKYPLTGSQAYINVVLEEVRRENPKSLKQYVAIRATIIEFLQDNGQPIKSVESPYNNGQVQQRVIKEEQPKVVVAQEVEKKEPLTEEEMKMQQLAEKKVNKFYIAYLYKSKQLNNDRSVFIYFNRDEIVNLTRNWALKDLLRNSKGYDVEFERYILKK